MQGTPTIDTPLVDGWDNAYLRTSTTWRTTVPSEAVSELLAHLERNGSVSATLHEAEFPFFGAHAAKVRHELSHGHGLAWIRPSPAFLISDSHHRAMFSVLCSLLGMAHRPVPTGDSIDPAISTVMLDGLVPDVVGGLRLSRIVDSADAPGSEVFAVSSVAVHREIEALQPELLKVLYRPVVHDVTYDIHTNVPSIHRAPVFRYEPTSRSLEFRYDRDRIERAHAEADVPLERPMGHAFDALDKAMNMPHLLASIRPDRGDMVFINNKRVATIGLSSVTADTNQVVRALRVVNPRTSEAESTIH